MLTPPNILTIAGSDSGGGAGIQADLKTIMALGGYGMSVITALTAQNGCGVTGIHAPDPDFVLLQLQTVLEGFPVAAAKTGMLFSAPIIRALGTALRKRSFPLVVDPVSVSQSRRTPLPPWWRRCSPAATCSRPTDPKPKCSRACRSEIWMTRPEPEKNC